MDEKVDVAKGEAKKDGVVVKKGMSAAKQAAYERKQERIAKVKEARERMRAKKYDPRGISKVTALLMDEKQMPRKPEANNLSARKFAKEMATPIRELRKRGYTFDEIASKLAELNFPITGIELDMVFNPQAYVLKKKATRKGEAAPAAAQREAKATAEKPIELKREAEVKPEAEKVSEVTKTPETPTQPAAAGSAGGPPPLAAAAAQPPPRPVGSTPSGVVASVQPVTPKSSATVEVPAKSTGIFGRLGGAGKS